MLTIILESLVPIFFVLGLGYLAGRSGSVDNEHVADLNSLVMEYAVPAAILVAVAQASRDTLIRELPLAAVLSLSMLILYGLVYLVVRRAFAVPPAEASVQALTASLPNYAAAGLPLIAALLGPKNLVSVAVSIACGSIVVSPLTLVILEATAKPGGERTSIGLVLLHALRKPIVIAPLLAVAYAFTGLGLPDIATRSLTLIGEVAGGAALFLTGLILSAQTIEPSRNTAMQVLICNVAHPLLAAGLAWLFALAPVTAREAIVLTALPSGFFGILFGLRFGTPSPVVGTTLLASTLLSAVTLAGAIYFTSGLR